VRSWNLREIETPAGSRSPVVLDSDEAARAVLIGLDPGQELGEHQVKEHAFVLVVDGSVRVETGGETFLLFLAPWPGEGHYRGEERA
jgi:quercetin dioxygenase-like cupin family protein